MDDWLLAIVVDTNLWISALINPRGAPARLMEAVLSGRVQLVVSSPLLTEIHDVSRRDRIRRRIQMTDPEIDASFAAISKGSRVARVDGRLRLCRDPKDDIVVETAIEGSARYIVSRDEDLTRDLDLVNALQEYGIEVLTVARFLDLLDAEPA